VSRECSFCNPDELAERLIHNDLSSVISVLSNPSALRFHTLIVPRRHVVPTRDVLTEEEILQTEFEKDRLIDLFRKMGFKGVDAFQKTRPEVPEGFSGIKMDHLHTHILPSNPGDEVYDRGFLWGDKKVFRLLDTDEMVDQLNTIRRVERAA
jgi:diadenosine tetraphosphate (Ap4A) HIT family hydrolase